MQDWLTTDATGTTIHLPPIPEGLATLGVLVAAGIALALVLALLTAWSRRTEHTPRLGRLWRSVRVALTANYLWLILLFAVVLFAVVAGFFRTMAWPALSALSRTVLDPIAAGGEVDAEAVRAFVYGLAALTGALAILATIPFQLVRVWINERTAATGEQNLITDLINKAVEGLGAEKTITRIGRSVTFRERVVDDPQNPLRVTEIEWQGHETADESADIVREEGDWQTFEQTVPNIEVRVGAILSLERVARTSDADHVRIMEILCAYIRENAPASACKDHGLGAWPNYPEKTTIRFLATRTKQRYDRSEALRVWIAGLKKPRADIQTAIEVIGRRTPAQIDLERRHPHREGGGYRLDLREANLRRADLLNLNFNHAQLFASRLEGAFLGGAHLERATFTWAHLEGAVLSWSYLSGALLSEAHLYSADLRGAHLKLASLGGTNLEETDLRGAEDLTQEQLENVIGDETTLLPDNPPLHVWTCWAEPPDNLDALLEREEPFDAARAALRARWLCGPDNPRRPTGTPLALDAPYPDGHPLADRE